MNEPVIIQGGMGAGVSNWRLARTVSRMGQLGVVSGTALDNILARRLQDGDRGGHMRRSLRRFPFQGVIAGILKDYFRPFGRKTGEPYKNVPMFTIDPPPRLLALNVVANFVEVDLAKEGHNGQVGVNYLEKVQMHSLSCLYGAMLAGVDYVLMGAGIPRAIPGILDRLARHLQVSMRIDVDGTTPDEVIESRFDPRGVVPEPGPDLRRPKFIAIVASNALATTLARKSSGRVDGFVIEGPTAGGHNAPPREKNAFNRTGEPLYGPRDEVDLVRIRELGLPFWLAGSFGSRGKLTEARESGAVGIQVGTAFAYTRESGLTAGIKDQVLGMALSGKLNVFTDPAASPTGFPFKVVKLDGTNSESSEYRNRPRICNLGYLRIPYKDKEGNIGYRCSGEPENQYVNHGGDAAATVGRKCLCNGLMANIGLPQIRDAYVEKPLVTSGEEVRNIGRFLTAGMRTYSAGDVIRNLLGTLKVPGNVESRLMPAHGG